MPVAGRVTPPATTRRLLVFEEHSANKTMPVDTGRVVVDSLTFSEFALKEFGHDKEGNWVDDISDGNDHSIDAVRYAMMEDVLRG